MPMTSLIRSTDARSAGNSPLGTPLTDRDRVVLRLLGRLRAAPVPVLAAYFPSQAAAYVRLGLLAQRGLVRRSSAFGRRLYVLTARGAAAVGLPAPRSSAVSPSTSRLAALLAVLAPMGYREAAPPRRLRRSVTWAAREGSPWNGVALYVSSQRITRRRATRIVPRLGLMRNAARAIIIAGGSRTRPEVVRDPLYPPVLVTPVPVPARALAAFRRYLS